MLLLSLFAAFLLWRLLRSVRRGLSIRMQVFMAMATVSGVFAAMLGLMAVQRLELRAARRLNERLAGENRGAWFSVLPVVPGLHPATLPGRADV